MHLLQHSSRCVAQAGVSLSRDNSKRRDVMGVRNGALALILACAAGLVGPSAWAQTETGRITGKVTDPQGIAVPGVTVTATSITSGASRTTATDATGGYVLANMLATTYVVDFSLQGFKRSTARVLVTVGSSVTADTKLEIG